MYNCICFGSSRKYWTGAGRSSINGKVFSVSHGSHDEYVVEQLCHMLNQIVCHVAHNFQNPILFTAAFCWWFTAIMFTVTDSFFPCNTVNLWCCLAVIYYKYLGIATTLVDFFQYLITSFGLDLMILWSWT